MAKKLDVTHILKDFEGKDIIEEDKPLTVKEVLLTYIRNSHVMDITESEKTSAYVAGLAIGTGGANTTLEQNQYDVIKKLIDSNKVTLQNEKKVDLYGILVQQQVKQLLDDALVVKKD